MVGGNPLDGFLSRVRVRRHMEPREEALRHLEAAQESTEPGVRVAVAAVYALLEVADVIRHGLRDVIYELRD